MKRRYELPQRKKDDDATAEGVGSQNEPQKMALGMSEDVCG